MIKAAIILAVVGAASSASAEDSFPNLECLRDSVQLSDVTFVELGEGIALPKVIGSIENNMPWAITGFRFDYGVKDIATGTVWINEYGASGELNPPLMPGESRDFVADAGYFASEDINTIRLSPAMWDVTDPDGFELIDDHRAVTVASYQRPRSQRNC